MAACEGAAPTAAAAPKRKIVFLTGTRADFGKLKSLVQILEDLPAEFEVHLFVTGMHMLRKYGHTFNEVVKCGFRNVHAFINQNHADSMDAVLGKTILGFSDYVKELRPIDLVVVHGDRVEALAGACVGSMNNIRVAHIEGGEVSGTVDELIRHAVTKMSHLHFVSNDASKARLQQLGEIPEHVWVIGSPDLDIMCSPHLPALAAVKQHYEIAFAEYGILLFHPVTTEVATMRQQARALVDALLQDEEQEYVVIYPNNDLGSDLILEEYERLREGAAAARFRVFPSIRFEAFLTLLRHARFMVGNSSAGVREAPHYGVPSVDIGTRQRGRAAAPSIVHCAAEPGAIRGAVAAARALPRQPSRRDFGDGRSYERFVAILRGGTLWAAPQQKVFQDSAVRAAAPAAGDGEAQG